MKNLLLPYIIITAFASLLFIPFLGNVHLFDWDEINFTECAREMIVSKNYSIVQINFQPFWEKPPLFIWMQLLSMNLFGVNEFASRLPNAICGIITLLTIFYIGKKKLGKQFAVLWVLVFAGSILPHFYFKTAIIDPWFNLFIFLGVYQIILFFNNPIHNIHIIYSAIFIGLGILTKGPVALLIFLLCICIYWIKKKSPIVSLKQIFLFTAVLILIGGSWFFYLIASGNEKIVLDFIVYQIRLLTTEDSGHGGPFYFHFLVLLIGCFPASVFALRSVFPSINIFPQKSTDTPFNLFLSRWMLILFWIVLILFSIVKTKIIHYSSLCYFPLTFFAAWNIQKILNGEIRCMKWMNTLGFVVTFLLGTIFILAPCIEIFKMSLIESGFVKDVFAIENLKTIVQWNGTEWLIGFFFLILTFYFFRKISQGKYKFIYGIFIVSLLTTNLLMIAVVPKVEQYTQGAAIEFYKSKMNENCIVETIGFKSFAHLFYTNYEPLPTTHKPLTHYFVSKITGYDKMKKEYPKCIELYRKNGFIFWKVVE
ncbi:MAG: glycosyltransferase family 39 protein [Bacteroidota bacterium]